VPRTAGRAGGRERGRHQQSQGQQHRGDSPIRTALQRNIAPNEPPDLVLGSLGTRHTALGAIALALDETNWLPVVARPA
jgi:hypothetical protein